MSDGRSKKLYVFHTVELESDHTLTTLLNIETWQHFSMSSGDYHFKTQMHNVNKSTGYQFLLS